MSCFPDLASNKPSALTYRDHRVRDTCQFLSCRRFQSLFLRPSLALSPACCDPGALPCGFEQPSEVALAPLLIVWLGANYKTIILAGISVAIFGSILNLYTSFTEIDPDSLKLIRTLGGKRKDELLRVALPSSVPYLLSVMKVNIGLCLVGVVIGEFIGARQGLGFLIIYSSQIFKLDWMILSIILLCIIAMILYQAVSLVEKRVVHTSGADRS